MVPLNSGWEEGQKCPTPLTLEIFEILVQLTSNLVSALIYSKRFQNCPMVPVQCPNFAEVSTFLTVMTDSLENQEFNIICPNMTK